MDNSLYHMLDIKDVYRSSRKTKPPHPGIETIYIKLFSTLRYCLQEISLKKNYEHFFLQLNI